ncbi:MAG: SemiSWEET transporter [Balneolaceae bacterium]
MTEITYITFIGFGAATLTTIAFLPQVIKTWKSKTAKDLSFGTFSILSSGVFLWLVYGLLIGDLPIILANAVTLLLVGALVFFKLTFKD